MNICGTSLLRGSEIRDMLELNLRKFTAKWEADEEAKSV
jgi:hypothetical protein